MKITKNFHVEELVHPEYIEQYGREKMIKIMENRHTSQDAARNKAFLIDMVNTEARERVAQGTLLTDKIHNITLTVEKLLVMQNENSQQIKENSRQLSKIIGAS